MRSHCFTDIANRSVFCASSETTYRHRGLADAERPAALRPVRVRRTDRDNTNSDVTVRQDGGAKKTETPDEATRRNDDRIKCGRRTTIHGPAALFTVSFIVVSLGYVAIKISALWMSARVHPKKILQSTLQVFLYAARWPCRKEPCPWAKNSQ